MTVENFSGKIIKTGVFIVLSVSILSVLISGRINILINPRYYPLVYISAVIMLIFIFQILLSREPLGFTRKYLWNCFLIVFISVCIFLSSYEEFQRNSVKVKTVHLQSDIPVSEPSSEPSSASQSNPASETMAVAEAMEDSDLINAPSGPVVFEDEKFIVLFNDVFRNPEDYLGRRVDITGFAVRSPLLPADHFIIARMAMYCCAAHAVMMGMICLPVWEENLLEENRWYHVEGEFVSRTFMLEGEETVYPVISVENIEAVESFVSPYVYPVF